MAELRTPNLPQLTLWAPDAYKDQITNLTLYKGIVIGIAGLLALFLTIVFVVRGAVIFPASAALAWASPVVGRASNCANQSVTRFSTSRSGW